VRDSLARSYDLSFVEPDIQVVDVDLLGSRHLKLRHTMHDNVPLAEKSRDAVLRYTRRLWGYDTFLTGVDAETDAVRYEASTVGSAE
jgi:spore cortex formation protein SpoVR/YcgB (stage V sporulation)